MWLRLPSSCCSAAVCSSSCCSSVAAPLPLAPAVAALPSALLLAPKPCLLRSRLPVTIRQPTSAYVSLRQHTPKPCLLHSRLSQRQHTSAYVQHTSAFRCMRQQMSAYVSIHLRRSRASSEAPSLLIYICVRTHRHTHIHKPYTLSFAHTTGKAHTHTNLRILTQTCAY